MAYTIKVNGQSKTVDVDADTPLLWVLRDVLDMSGTKFGCGIALCGACTVHIDGVPARSCVTRIDTIGDKPITTIEAIGQTPIGRPCRRRGSNSRLSSAAIASPGKSCRRRRCLRA